MQIIVDNSAGEMMPGDYASIRLQAASAAQVLSVPSSAIIFDAKVFPSPRSATIIVCI